MRVLGIETATSVCSVAFVHDARVISERALAEKNVHAERILTLVGDVLRDAHCVCADVDGIAVSIGPGSFTGLRIGLSVAKGLAYSLEKPLISVPTLRALAQRVVDLGRAPSGAFILPLIDARRNEVYCQCFAMNAAELVPLWPERDMTVADLLVQIGDRDVIVTGDACEKLAAYQQERARETGGHITYVDKETSKCSAASVAAVGEEMLVTGRRDDPVSLEPLYVKDVYLKPRNAVHTV